MGCPRPCLPIGLLLVFAILSLAGLAASIPAGQPLTPKDTLDLFFKSVDTRQKADFAAKQMGVSVERLLGVKFQSLLNPPWMHPAFRARLDDSIDDSLRKLIATLQRLLETMAEPLKIEKVVLDRHDPPLLEMKGYVQNVRIEKLSTFNIEKVKVDLQNLKASLKANFTQLDAHGNYNIDAQASGQLHIFGDGDFHIRLYEPVIQVDVEFGYGNERFSIKSLNVFLKMSKLKVILENFLGGGAVGDLVSNIVSDVGPAVLDEYHEQVSDLISREIKDTANALLAKVPLQTILDWISGSNSGSNN